MRYGDISSFFRNITCRTISFDVPPQEILTKDSVTVSVDAVCFFKVNYCISSYGRNSADRTKPNLMSCILWRFSEPVKGPKCQKLYPYMNI